MARKKAKKRTKARAKRPVQREIPVSEVPVLDDIDVPIFYSNLVFVSQGPHDVEFVFCVIDRMVPNEIATDEPVIAQKTAKVLMPTEVAQRLIKALERVVRKDGEEE